MTEGRRFNLAEQFREALALAWQRALQALEDHQSTSSFIVIRRPSPEKSGETQKGFSVSRFPRALERERGEGWGAKLCMWPGMWVHRDSYGFVWVLCWAGHQAYACLYTCLWESYFTSSRARFVRYADAHVLFFWEESYINALRNWLMIAWLNLAKFAPQFAT